MSIARYKVSHSKPRSPIPPSGFQSVSSSRPFLPPAHYAAAAGLASNGQLSSTDHGSVETILPSTSSSASANPAFRNTFKPVSYASQSSHSDISPFESNAALSNRLYTGKRRQSQLGNLPMLEAQLVPSLRDTISRMTKPPQTNWNEPSSHTAFTEPPDRFGHQTYMSSSSVSVSNSLHQPLDSQLTPVATSYATYATSPARRGPRSAPSTPVEQSVAQPKLKSALKSALRPPTPKLSKTPDKTSALPGGSNQSSKTTFSMGRKSQAPSSMVADIKRGAGIASYNKPSLTNVKLQEPAERSSRTRSRTDPGTTTKIPSVLPPVATPQPNTSWASRNLRRIASPQPKHQDNDSEAERFYDPEGRGNRRLVVTNAVVVPSSSSESNKEQLATQTTSRLPKLKEQYVQARNEGEQQTRYGLGLGFGEHGAKLRDIFTDSTNRIAREDDDDCSVYEDDVNDPRTDGRLRSAPSMVSGSEWDSQEIIQDRRTSRGSLMIGAYDEESPDIHRKRRAALLGIVQGLDQGSRSKSRMSRTSSSLEDREYNVQEGFAISNLGHFDAGATAGSGRVSGDNRRGTQDRFYENDPSRRHDYHAGQRQEIGPILSRSPLPTFTVSTEDDNTVQGHNRCRTSPTPGRSRSPRPKQTSNNNFLVPGRMDPYQHSREDVPNNTWDEDPSMCKESYLRSPVIRNTANAPINHVAYQDSRKARFPNSVEDLYGRKSRKLSNTPQKNAPTYNEPSDISRVAENSSAAATRQREAFGIPRPISDYYTDSIHEDASRELPHANSDLSSVGDGLWREDCQEFSVEAETLFKKLRGESHARKRYPSPRDKRELLHNDHELKRERSNPPLSRNSDVSSLYNDHSPRGLEGENDAKVSSDQSSQTWQSSLPSSVYRSLLEQYGDVEMRRQEVIWELCQTERAFVDHLHCVVRLFVQPLRAQNSKSWIAGVPPDVARLFDWLEDIANMHSQISDILHATRKGHYSIVERVADSLKGFVPKLEIYQPYLVRLEDIAALIECLMKDDQSDFGDFVTIQESSADCDGWSLERFLIEPVNRLAQYPELFRRLLALTPINHPDHLPTFSLLHSTNMIIRVLSEVKFREDEYDIVKDISTRIQGLPPCAQLAKRERRLLTQGTLHCMIARLRKEPSSASHSSAVPNCNSKFATAINSLSPQRGRSGPIRSGDVTTRFYETPFTSPAVNFNKASLQREKPRLSPSPKPSSQELSRTMVVHVFVFNDLIVLATPITRMSSNKCQNWRLLEDVGIARILTVTRTNEPSDSRASFVLHILPMTTAELDSAVVVDNHSVVPLYLSIPDDSTHISQNSSTDFDETSIKWLSAFRRCSDFTLRSLSFLSHSGGHLDHGPDVDLELDTHQSVLAIMASGLPLPKSPSVQLEEVVQGESENPRQQEREERGWWSLRFQQVLREMQRRDALSSPSLTHGRTLKETS